MARDISDTNPDPVEQLNEFLLTTLVRDAADRPLGDVLGHALGRASTSYAVLEASALVRDNLRESLGGPDRLLEFRPTAAGPQDWQYTSEYPAAHLSPCNIVVARTSLPTLTPQTPIYDVFLSPLTRSHVYGVLEETEIVHVLVNLADIRVEGLRRRNRQGQTHILAEACTMVARDGTATPRQVFHEFLLPRFREVAATQLAKADAELARREPSPPPPALVDMWNRPYPALANPGDTKIHSATPENWRANRRALVQVLRTFQAAPPPQADRIRFIAGQFEALRHNERVARGRR